MRNARVTLTGVHDNGNGGQTYDVDAAGVLLSVEFSPVDGREDDLPWEVTIHFVQADRDLGVGGASRRAAFLGGTALHPPTIAAGTIPPIDWRAVEQALDIARAFR